MTKILCVDDNDNNIFMMRKILQRAGFEVVAAVDGESALAIAKAERPDLILMDLVLPGIDGLEATRGLKAAPETSAIPVIALSAHEEREKGAAARAAGCDDYAHKPINLPSLLEQIQRLLEDPVGGARPVMPAPSAG